MKKLFSMVFVIALVLSLMTASAAAEGSGSIQLSASASEVHPGDTFTVTVTITSNPGTAYINFTPSYDTGKLELTNKAVGSGWTAGATSISWDSATVETISGYAATLTFKVKDNATSGGVSVSGSVEAVAFEGDSDEFSVPFSVGGCSVSVQPAPHDHNWGSGVVTKEANCKEKGVRTYTCSICNETKTEDIPMTDHVTELRNKKDASCKEEGYTGDQVCKNCNQIITAGQTIAKTEHSWNTGVVTKEASCTEKGVRTYTCTVCNETKTEDIPMTAHVTELRNKKDASCKEEGYTGDEVCKNCNQVIKAGQTIAKTEHSWNEGTVTKEASCTEKGSKTVTCTVCNETKTVEIPMTDHETELRNKKDASCKEEGYTGDEVCKNCNQVIKAGQTIAKTEHSWNEGTVTKEASCKEKGSKTVTCTVCNETQTVEIPMLPHSWGPWEITVKAEDGKEGTRTHTCTECSTVASEAFTITTLEGAGGKYIKGSGKTLSFRFSEELALFEDIYVDGNKVDARNYSKASGSTVITLHNLYLSQLAAGTHTIRAVFSSGNVSTNFSCVSPSNTPSTGDNSNIVLWLGLLAVAAVGVGAVSIAARKKARAK